MSNANEDAQAEIGDIKALVAELLGDLDCAEGCDTQADLLANLKEAIARLPAIKKALAEALEDAKVSR